jgi:hypothetical protein
MWVVWLVTALAVVLFAIPTLLLWPDLRRAPRGWQLLAASGLPLALGGLGFIVRFWQPTPGPYLANQLYPYGPHLNAWAVSFGFMWLAFGLVFFASALRAPRTGKIWLALLVAWVLAWIPHGVIGIGFATAGSNQPSIDVYRAWGSRSNGFLTLASGSVVLLLHFGLGLFGFVSAGLALRRDSRARREAKAGRSA